MRIRARRTAIGVTVLVAVVLVAVDAFWVTAEVIAFRGLGSADSFITFTHWGWRADRDGSFAEIWGYLKAFTAAIVLFVLFLLLRRASVLLVTSLLFIAVGLDDMLRLHELGGGKLAALGLPNVFGTRGQDLGELMIWAAIGLPLAIAWVVTYLRCGPQPKLIARLLFIAFAALAVFAVGIDMITSAVVEATGNTLVTYSLTRVELVGELLGLTAVAVIPTWFLLRHVMGVAGNSDQSIRARSQPIPSGRK